MRLQPALEHRDDIDLLIHAQCPTRFNAVPFREAAATAARRCMLGHEYGVAMEWRLLAVIHRQWRRQTLGDEVPCMLQHRRHALFLQICELLAPQAKTPAKYGCGQGVEQGIHITHAVT